MQGINQSLSIVMFEDGEDASRKGYDYNEWFPLPVALNIEKAVVIQKGTVSGNSTVDFVLVDEVGNRYVTMITGNLLRNLVMSFRRLD